MELAETRNDDASATLAADQEEEDVKADGCWTKFEDWLAGDDSDEELAAASKPQEVFSEAEIEERLEKALSESNLNNRGQNFLILNSLIFIIFCISSNPVERIASVNSFVKTRLENTYFSYGPDKQFKDITNRNDLNNYIQKVLIPFSFPNEDNIRESVSAHNFLIALRFSLKRVKMADNEFDEYNEVIPEVKEFHNIPIESFSESEDTDDYAEYSYDEDGGYRRAGAYVVLMANMTSEEATERWEKMKFDYIDIQTSSLVIETLVQNSNLGVTIDYIQIFDVEDSGFVYSYTKSIGAFPELYETWTSFSTMLIGLFVLYVIGLCFHFYLTLSRISKILTVLWNQFKLEIPWNEYVGTASVVTVIVSASLYCVSTLAYIGSFELPMNSKDDIADLTDHLWGFKAFVQTSAVGALLTTLETIAILKDKFPSFGLLFDTVRRANVDITNFGIILTALMIAFGLMGTICFGAQAEEFSTVGKSMLTLFEAVLNKSFYSIVDNANVALSTLYYVAFVILFNFVLLNMFLAIVMSTFNELSDENSQLLKARASLTADEVKNLRNKWINLLCCRVEKSQEKDAIEYFELKQKIMDDDEEVPNQAEMTKLENLRQAIIKSRQPSLWEIITTNIGVISRDLYSHKVMRKEAIRVLIERIQRLEKEHRDKMERERALTKDMDYRYKQVREMIIFLFYVIFFTLFITYRLRVTETYDVYEAMSSAIVKPEYKVDGIKYDFYDNDRMSRVRDWTDNIFVPVLFQDNIGFQNSLVREPIVRITLQLSEVKDNDNPSTENANKLVCKDSISNRNFFTPAGTIFEFTDSGNHNSYKSEGGFARALNPFSQEFKDFSITLLNLSNQSASLIFIAIEYVTYNSNYDLFCYTIITFTQDLSGKLTPVLEIEAVQLDIYSGRPGLAVFEVIFVIFTFYYTFIEILNWLKIWKVLDKERKENQAKRKVAYTVLLNLGVYSEPEGGMEAIVLSVGRFLKNIVRALYYFLTQFLMATYKHVSESFFRLANVVCVVLSFGALYFELRIIASSFRDDFKQPYYHDYINDFSEIVQYQESLRVWLAFTLLLSYLRLLQFFNFSKKLSMLTDSLRSASLDVAFFIAMFCSILFSYSLMGYLLLGHYYDEFVTLRRSFVSCYTFLLGEFNLKSITSVDESLGLLFFISFSIIFNFLLINMFIAIIVGHYRLIQADYTRQKRGFFAEVLLILRSRCRKRRNDKSNKNKAKTIEKDLSPIKQEVSLLGADYEEVELEDLSFDPLTPNYYMLMLEKTLMAQTNNSLVFSKLKPEFLNMYDLNSVVRPAEPHEIAVINETIWSRLANADKLRMWRRMGLNWTEHKIKRNISLEITQMDKAIDKPLSPLQETLWGLTTERDRLDMWAGTYCFDDTERINIWNSVSFNEKNIPNTESEQTLQDWASKLITPLRKRSINLKKKPRQERLERVMEWKDVKDDERLRMWVILDDNEQMLIYMNQTDVAEANIISHMLMSEIGDNPILVGSADEALERLLDNQIHNKYYELAVFQAETCISAKNSERLEASGLENLQTKNYIKYLNDTIRGTQLKIEELRERYNLD